MTTEKDTGGGIAGPALFVAVLIGVLAFFIWFL